LRAQSTDRLRTHIRRAVALGLAGLVTFAAVVAMAGGQKAPTVALCATGAQGHLSVARGDGCGPNSRKIVLRKRGPRGPVGPRGSRGAPGLPGADAPPSALSPEPVQFVQTPPRSDCATAPGFFCSHTTTGISWSNGGGPAYADAGYRKDTSGFVHLQGLVQLSEPSGGNSLSIFYLPPGYRPTEEHLFVVQPCGGLVGSVEVSPDGSVATDNLGGTDCHPISLDGMSFHP
jgi:hypothetical protein